MKKILFYCVLCVSMSCFILSCTSKGDKEDEGDGLVEHVELADPCIYLEGDTYYLYGTGGSDGILVYTSNDLTQWEGPAGARDGYALFKEDSYGDQGFWAPQVFKYKDKLYMIYTANEQIAIAESNSPLGPFTQKEEAKLSGDSKQIDPFVFFDDDGKIYLTYVRLDAGNRLFTAEMKDDLSDIIMETRRYCIESEAGTWEDTNNSEWRVCEGPTVLKKDDKYYLLYSSNDFRNIDYAVGYAVSDSPMGGWEKYAKNPILDRQMVHRNGPGHGDLFKDKAGNLKYVLHYHASDSVVHPRKTALIDVVIEADGNGGNVISFDADTFKELMLKK